MLARQSVDSAAGDGRPGMKDKGRVAHGTWCAGGSRAGLLQRQSSAGLSSASAGFRACERQTVLSRRPSNRSWSKAIGGSKPILFGPISSRDRTVSSMPSRIDEGLKALIATGLFHDVRISRPGGRIVVTVFEAQVINRIAFEGNKKAKDEQINAEIQSKPRGHAVARDRAGRHPAHPRDLPSQRPVRRPDRAQDHRIAEQSRRSRSSRSTKARRPASSQSISSATAPIRRTASRT